jgi:glycosyltransferase involved in cell wall biosynthesis
MSPCVSVVIPVRDGERWIGEAIASLAAQSFRDFELLIVDDGSADKTGEVVAAVAQRDQRVRIIRLPPSGIVAALNCGLDQARGRYIARLDADDRAHSARLERQVAFLNTHPAVGVVGSWAEVIDSSDSVIGRLRPETAPAVLAGILMKRNPMLHSSVMWRAELNAKVGRYRAAFEAAEDYDLWLRMAEHCLLANIPDCLVQYRRHAGSISRHHRLRQMFSARLARRAAHGRRMHGTDPADALVAPPDWSATRANDEFYAADAKLYRFLELSAVDAIRSPDAMNFDLSAAQAGEFPMTHDERRLAQIALLNIIAADASMPPRLRMRLIAHFIRLHPARAMHLISRRLGRKLLGRSRT